MTFYGTNKAIVCDYTIDFVRKKVDIVGNTSFFSFLHDVFSNWLGFSLFYNVPFIVLLSVLEYLPTFVWYFMGSIVVFFLVFSVMYSVSNAPWIKKLQLMFEYPMYAPFMKRKETRIDITNTKVLMLYFDHYFTYKMLFYGDCKHKIKSIKYKHTKSLIKNSVLIVEFVERTNGLVVFEGRYTTLKRMTLI